MNKEKPDHELILLKVTQKFPSKSFLQEISSFSSILITELLYSANMYNIKQVILTSEEENIIPQFRAYHQSTSFEHFSQMPYSTLLMVVSSIPICY